MQESSTDIDSIPQERTARSGRFAFLDWTRGIGALIMLQGHVFHSFIHPGLRESSPYILSQFVGGMPPAIFLFLTGVTLAFLMDSDTRRARPALDRIFSAIWRARYLMLVAFAFRLQLWVFAIPHSPWQDLFKVDILNSMAVGIVLLAPLAVFDTLQRVRLGAVMGIAVALLTPVINGLDWSGVHPFLTNYFKPDPNYFPMFPWAAFLAFGLSAGSILRLAPSRELPRVMQWAALLGIVLLFAGGKLSDLPYSIYPQPTNFWLDGPWLIFMKLGIVLVMGSFAYLWTEHALKGAWSWVAQLGTTSLLVYWVHTELVYGRAFSIWREQLAVPQTIAMGLFMIALMVGLSTLKTRWTEVSAWVRSKHPPLGRWSLFAPEPTAVEGD